MASPIRRMVFFVLALAIFVLAMRVRLGPELADDGAFFLRYAENMLHGQFWVWNLGEAPVWGASAPLYPLVIALAMKLGLAPVPALVDASIAMAALGLALVALTLARRIGLVAGLAFVFLASLDTGAMYFAGAGLETPLTFLLMSLGVWCVLSAPRQWMVGAVAGLLMVNKLDLVPVGGLLLLACWLRSGKFPMRAFVVAAGVALAWYGFAWIYFGAPVPNSFLTKSLHQGGNPSSMSWKWFASFALLDNHVWLVGLSVLGAALKRRALWPIAAFLFGTVLVHLVAYTIKFPFEPYNWYAMPAVFSLLVMAAIGVDAISAWLAARAGKLSAGVRVGVPLAILLTVGFFSRPSEQAATANIKWGSAYQEFDRAEAGRWVAENTPRQFRVYTMWGNPAYYSQRYVIDGSYLNRKFSADNEVASLRPEILIMQNNPGSTPSAPVFANHIDQGYSIVKVFDKTFTTGQDYFFAVLARDDILGEVRNAEPPRALLDYVSDRVLGDQYGLLNPYNSSSLFVHPGANTPTRFVFDLAAFAKVTGQTRATVSAAIADNMPAEALARGAGNVNLRIAAGDTVLRQAVVKAGQPLSMEVDVAATPKLTVMVDNNGSPDTDWLIFSVR